MIDLDNLNAEEKEFKHAVESVGIPTTDEAFRAEWQQLADESNVPIANPSKYSAFWVFVTLAVTNPVRWLLAFMIRHVMPNMYVKTASGTYLDLLGWAYDVERKPAVKARGNITFRRENDAQQLLIPAGARVRTVPIRGNIYRMITLEDALMDNGVQELEVPCEAENPGGNYNLGAGYYGIMDSDVPGITGVTNKADYLGVPGADTESDAQFRLRIRYQFAASGDWHTDAKYRSLIALNTGFRPDRIYFLRYDGPSYPCRGPGSADAFVLFDAGTVPDETLLEVNRYIRDQDNHGHGDDLMVFAMPETVHDVAVDVKFRRNTTTPRRQELLQEIENVIRCAFRENQDYLDQVTPTWAYSRFAFSQLDYELHSMFHEIEALIWAQDDIISDLDVPRLGELTISEVM